MKQPICFLAIAAAIALGCGGEGKSTAPEIEIYRPQTSIANVLHNLIEAHERRDIGAYEKLFADEFFFVFDPQDVIENPDIPQEWAWNDDVAAARNMFDEPLVEKVTLDFVVGEPNAAAPLDELRHPFPPGTTKTLVSEVELGIDTRDPEGGENIILQVRGDQAIFFLYPHPTETVEGLPVWYIIEWRDKRIRFLVNEFGSIGGGVASFARGGRDAVAARELAVRENTWGGIKSVFR